MSLSQTASLELLRHAHEHARHNADRSDKVMAAVVVTVAALVSAAALQQNLDGLSRWVPWAGIGAGALFAALALQFRKWQHIYTRTAVAIQIALRDAGSNGVNESHLKEGWKQATKSRPSPVSDSFVWNPTIAASPAVVGVAILAAKAESLTWLPWVALVGALVLFHLVARWRYINPIYSDRTRPYGWLMSSLVPESHAGRRRTRP